MRSYRKNGLAGDGVFARLLKLDLQMTSSVEHTIFSVLLCFWRMLRLRFCKEMRHAQHAAFLYTIGSAFFCIVGEKCRTPV